MKILHTGDWHIGKLVLGVHMTEDQKYILKMLLDLIKESNSYTNYAANTGTAR